MFILPKTPPPSSPSSERRSSGRVRRKAAVLEDDNYMQDTPPQSPTTMMPVDNDNGEVAKNGTNPDGLASFLDAPLPQSNPFTQLYGRARPPPAPRDVCAVCHNQDVQRQADVILLCDGHGCIKEYHLTCANLKKLPAVDEPFYCDDCHPVGRRTAALQQYLAQHLDEREGLGNGHGWSQAAVWRAMVAQDSAKHLSTTTSPRKLKTVRIPRSELHSPQIWWVLKQKRHDERQSLDQKNPNFIGCPVRLYIPSLQDYIAGRIVDHRQIDGIAQHYVRFPAGGVGQKQRVATWMVLEEHALMVNTGIVVAAPEGQSTARFSSPGARHTPRSEKVLASAWARTSRHLLTKRLFGGYEAHYLANETPWSFDPNRGSDLSPWVLLRDFGSHRSRIGEAKYLKDWDGQEFPNGVPATMASLALAEYQEKQRIREWHALGTVGRGPWLRRDVDELEPALEPRPRIRPAPCTTRGLDVTPCLAVRPGLDRTYLAQRLQRQGVEGMDRVGAAGLRCHGARSFYHATSRPDKKDSQN